MQRNDTLRITFGTGNFRTAQTAGSQCLDTLGAGTHGLLNSLLLGNPEGLTSFELFADLAGNQVGVEVRVGNLDNFDLHCLAACELGQFGLQGFHLILAAAVLADHVARPRAADDNLAVLLGSALDFHSGNVCAAQIFLQILADLDVFIQKISVISFVCIPSGFPVTNDTDTHADRAYFLSHIFDLLPYRSSTTTVMWLVLLRICDALPLARGIHLFSVTPSSA